LLDRDKGSTEKKIRVKFHQKIPLLIKRFENLNLPHLILKGYFKFKR
jgi:hypothetical protein